MRKFFIASALTVVAAAAMYSCNNGKYDANPDTDYGAGLNHLTGDSTSAKVYLGTMEATINHKQYIFSPAICYQDENGAMKLIARIKDDSVFRRTLRITYNLFEGKRVDSIFANTVDPSVHFIMVDTGNRDVAGRQIYKDYTANTGESFGYAYIDIQGNEGGNLRGFLHGKLYKFLPDAKETESKYSMTDTMSFELSHFYFLKVPFPVPDTYQKYLQN